MLELRHLTKTYGAVRALEDFSLAVRPGEAVALIGPNGSGKTTVLKCAAGLATPTSGSVRIGSLSYLPQHVCFDEHFTCREILEFYARLRRLSPDRAAGMLASWGLESDAGRPVAQLSGGQVQRLGVAVAMLPDAAVLLLDEPTANLDPAAALALRDALREAKRRGRAILFASHTLADAEAAADRVAIVLAGRLAALESLEALRFRLRSESLEEIYLRYVEESHPAAGGLLGRLPVRAARAD